MIEVSEILANGAVRLALGNLAADAARQSGVASHHAIRISLTLQSRLATGAPNHAAIKVVEAIRDYERAPTLCVTCEARMRDDYDLCTRCDAAEIDRRDDEYHSGGPL
jgi:hypothetical protein